jgi:pimeloyl-ACP methyl ester carboxylesterase
MKQTLLLLAIAFQCLALEAQGDIVVCVHGFLATSRSMKTVKKALECCDFEVWPWDYPTRQKFIEEHASVLASYLQLIAQHCPNRPIHFVAYSIGALVLRAALNMPNCPAEAKIGRAVLLAPPNQGSRLARRFRNVPPIAFVMGNHSGWQLMHYRPCCIAARFGEFPPSMSVLVIAGVGGNKIWHNGPNDGFITLEETRLNTPFYSLCFSITHGDLLTNPAVLCGMRNFLLTSPKNESATTINNSGPT